MQSIHEHFDVSHLERRFGVSLTGQGAVELLAHRIQSAVERWRSLKPEDRDTAEAAEAAWDLLACWAGTRRIRPALLQGPDMASMDVAVGETVAQDGELLARLVIESLPEVDLWSDAARAYADEVDDPTLDPGERSQAAREYLADLDDATVVERALEMLGFDVDEQWSESAVRAVELVTADPGAWIAAWMWIADHRAAFDPDLAETDAALALTQDNFLSVLEALDEVSSREPWPVAVPGEVPSSEVAARHVERRGRWICRRVETLLAASGRSTLDPTSDADDFMDLRGRRLRLAWCEVVSDDGGWRQARDGDAERLSSALAVSLSGVSVGEEPADVVPTLDLRVKGQSLPAYRAIVEPTQVVLVAARPADGVIEVVVAGETVAEIPLD